MADDLKHTPLHEEHRRLGAKLVPFAGWEMPVQYEGILAEHQAVRRAAGLFDVSHMGEFEIRGEDPLGLVQLVTTNDASRLEVGQAQYTVMCQEDGGAIDDCLVYRLEDHYMIVVNASNVEKDLAWIRKFAPRFGCEVVDRTDEIALLALQGPKAAPILERALGIDASGLGYYHFAPGEIRGQPALVSRTGYTGEDGFELYVPAGLAAELWRTLLETGEADGLRPIGLGARDSLRLEMGYILYGNDLDSRRTPLEAGLGWVVKLDKGEFLGRPALQHQKQEGVREKLVGFQLEERGFPRHGYELRIAGEPAGEVTSGVLSPSLDRGVGLGYLAAEAARPGTAIEVVIRNKPLAATVVRPPFYQEGSVKR